MERPGLLRGGRGRRPWIKPVSRRIALSRYWANRKGILDERGN
jgi:hypothetical protein